MLQIYIQHSGQPSWRASWKIYSAIATRHSLCSAAVRCQGVARVRVVVKDKIDRADNGMLVAPERRLAVMV